jgi:hypothetical protein
VDEINNIYLDTAEVKISEFEGITKKLFKMHRKERNFENEHIINCETSHGLIYK